MRKRSIALSGSIFSILIVFQTLIMPCAFSEENNIFDMSIQELMSISIATKTEMSMAEAPSIVSVITADEIKNMGARNLEDILRTIVGARFDYYDDVGSSTTPRLGIVYSPTENLYCKFLYGEAFRAPSFYEMYAKNNPTCLGNPELRPETITTIEGLIGYNFTKKIQSSITFFYIEILDLIEKSVVSGQTLLQWENTRAVESQGL